MKINTKNKELGQELKAAIQRLEENLEANAPPLIIEDLSSICLYKFARMVGYDLRKHIIEPTKDNLYKDFDKNVKLDIAAFNEFTGRTPQKEYSYY